MAIVAGAGGALGQAMTRTLAASGHLVVAVDRDKGNLGELPQDVQPAVADATDPAEAKSVIEGIARDVGAPRVLVNTIGAFQPGEALAETPETLQLMIDVNLGAALWLSQAVAPHMVQRGSGAIVHVTSRPGIEPTGGMGAASSVSKAALVHLTRVLDLELRPQGIRVNAVAPQVLDTPVNRGILPAEVMAQAVSPEAIAEEIGFLVSDAAAPVSGAILPAYGG